MNRLLIFTHSTEINSFVLRYPFSIIFIHKDERQYYLVEAGKEQLTFATFKNLVTHVLEINNTAPVQKVLSFHEHYHILAYRLSRKLGLEFTHPLQLITTVNNKSKFRTFLNKHGFDKASHRIVKNENEISEFISENGLPVVLKPIDGVGSIGVSIIRNVSDIKKSIKWLRTHAPRSRMLLEQFAEGKEYSVEAFSTEKGHKVFNITEKFKDPIHFVGMGHLIPAPMAESLKRLIEATIEKMLNKLNVRSGPTHTELIVKGDSIYIIETHIRLPGAKIPVLLSYVYGINITELWVKQLMGIQIDNDLKTIGRGNRFAAIWFDSPNESGTLEQVNNLEKAREVESIVKLGLNRNIGEKVTCPVIESAFRVCYAIAVDDSPEKALLQVQTALKKVSYVVTPDKKEVHDISVTSQNQS